MEFDARDGSWMHQSQSPKDMIGLADVLLLFRRFWITHLAAIIIGSSLAACYAFYFFPKDQVYNTAKYTISVAADDDDKRPALGIDQIKRVIDFRLSAVNLFGRLLKERVIANHGIHIPQQALQILSVDRLEQETPDTVTIVMRMPLELQEDISSALLGAINKTVDQMIYTRSSRLTAEEDKVFASYLKMAKLSLVMSNKVKLSGIALPPYYPLSWNPSVAESTPNIMQLLAIAVAIPDEDPDKSELIKSLKSEYFAYLRNLDDLHTARRDFNEIRGIIGLVFTHVKSPIQEPTFANRRFSRVVRFSVAGAVLGIFITFLITGISSYATQRNLSKPEFADETR